LTDDYLLKSDATLNPDSSDDSDDFADHAGDGAPAESDDESSESNESDLADRSDLGPIETTVLETVEEYIEIPDQDVHEAINGRIGEIVDRVASRVDGTPDPISVDLVDDQTVDVGVQHGYFPALLRLTRLEGIVPYIHGMPGGGKSHAVEAVAEAMGLDFASGSCSAEMSKFSDFLGIFNPQSGEFMETDFIKFVRNGGLYLLDEVDRAPAGVSLFLNTLMANDTISLHGETVEVHEDFELVAAGNTEMRGRSKRYRAGSQDVAFIDRLAFVEWPTDEALEATLLGVNPEKVGANRPEIDLSEPDDLAQNTTADWLDYCQSIRKALDDLDMEYIASMRASQKGQKMLSNGFPRDFVEHAVIWRGASKDVRQRVKDQATQYAHR